jgi:hypothetical protein
MFKKIKIPKINNTILIFGIIVLVIFGALFLYRGFFVAATINGKSISRLAVITELEKQGGKRVLDTMITKEIIFQEAQKKGVTANQKEIDAEIKKIEKNISTQGLTLDQALAQQGMTKADLNSEVKVQVLLQKLTKGKTTVSEKEIDDYIKANKDQFPANAKTKPPRAQIKAQLLSQKQQQKIQQYVEALRAKAKISILIKY